MSLVLLLTEPVSELLDVVLERLAFLMQLLVKVRLLTVVLSGGAFLFFVQQHGLLLYFNLLQLLHLHELVFVLRDQVPDFLLVV